MKVTLQGITKKFPSLDKKSRAEVTAVDNFSIALPDGKLIGLLGPSGCGKSTVLSMICGLQKPTEGRIFFGEDDVTDLPPENRGVGLVFQNYALYPHLTVLGNIIFPLQNLRGSDKMKMPDMVNKAREIARLVQIDELMDRKPSELSGGQQQRVAIARALVKMPRVLLLDEPLSNLDARLRLQTREEIRRIQKETGITTVFVTHDQEEAMSISDMIVVMKSGVIQQTGVPQNIYDDPTNLFVAKFLGTPPISVYEGHSEGGGLFIGGDRIMADTDLPDGEKYIGIRPEGYLPDENGSLHNTLIGVEVMGRDISVVSSNPSAQSPSVRAIISSDSRIDTAQKTVAFSLKPNKVFVFDKNTEERIRFRAE